MAEPNLATVAEDAKVAYTLAHEMWRQWRDEKDADGDRRYDNLKKLSQHLDVWSRDAEQALTGYSQQLALTKTQRDVQLMRRCRQSLLEVENVVRERIGKLSEAAQPGG